MNLRLINLLYILLTEQKTPAMKIMELNKVSTIERFGLNSLLIHFHVVLT